MDAKTVIELTLKSLNVNYVKEYKGIPNRKFRFDYFLPDFNIAIEYEGIYGGKSRHTNVTGYTNDTRKYNLAVINGYRVLRYTASNVGELYNDLNLLTNEKTNT